MGHERQSDGKDTRARCHGELVLEELALPRHDVESYISAMQKLREERLEVLIAGIRFCTSELIDVGNVSARAFLDKLAESAEELLGK